MLSQIRLVNRTPFYYGWVIAFIAWIGMSATSPGQSFTVSLFIDHYIEDFEITRTLVSTLYSVGTFLAALGLTWVGKMVDRHGNRAVGTVIVATFAAVLVALSQINGVVALVLSFILIRLLGQGSMFLVSGNAVAQWWRMKRGWVMGLALVGFALFQRVYLPELQRLIENVGWRTSWVVLGMIMGLVVAPLWYLFMRDRPEQYGLLPDGADRIRKRDGQEDDTDELDPEENWTLAEVRQLPIFWVFIIGRMFPAALVTGMVLHQVSIFEGLGYDAATAAATFGTIALINAGFTLIMGRIIQRFRPGHVMAFQLSMLVASMFLTMIMTDIWLVWAYAFCVGAIMGSGGVFDGTVWADLFGRLHHGSIRGFVATGMVVGTSIGPILFGASYDLFGSYDPILWAGIAATFVPIIASLMVNKPRKREVFGDVGDTPLSEQEEITPHPDRQPVR